MQCSSRTLITLCPFSHILLVWKNVVRVYQVGTGAWLRDLEKSDQKLVAIEFDRHNPKLLYGCSEQGQVIVWKWRSGVKEKRVQLHFNHNNTAAAVGQTHVYSFHVIPNDDMETESESQQIALVSYFDKPTQTVKIESFDLDSGKRVDEFDIPL